MDHDRQGRDNGEGCNSCGVGRKQKWNERLVEERGMNEVYAGRMEEEMNVVR